jgi:uncharacterized DUF497 family protein
MPDRKPLRFTRHAQDVVEERALDHSWIERTVREPEWSHPDRRQPHVERRFRTIPEFGGRILRVVCIETVDEIRILTVFFDRDARRPS